MENDNPQPAKKLCGDEVVNTLLQERDRHRSQILAANGRFSFSLMAFAGGAIVGAPKLRGAIYDPLCFALALTLLGTAFIIALWGMISYYLFHIRTVRFLESVVHKYACTGELPEELTKYDPKSVINPYGVAQPHSLLDFGHLILYADIAVLLSVVFFVLAVL